MKKIILILFVVILVVSCTKQAPYFDIPRDSNGNVILTGVSSTTTSGISTLDGDFSATATFATAKAGDVMKVELLKLQLPPGQTTNQLLPLAGTQKTVTVGSDMKASVSYTRAEAKLTKVTDYVTIIFSGERDYAKVRVDMVPSITVSNPKVGAQEINIARNSGTAYFNVTVVPKGGDYTGTLVVKRKNGMNGTTVAVTGSPFSGTQPFLVPISGNDFAVGKDSMYYTFSVDNGIYKDTVSSLIVVRNPYFYLKKEATLTLGSGSSGRNLLINASVDQSDATANVGVSGGSLILRGGAAWLAAGNSIGFVPTTSDMYEANNPNLAIADYMNGTPTATADPITGQGFYIFKIVNGTTPTDVYYGIIKFTNLVAGNSVSFEYRIGDQYAHLSHIH